MHVLFVEPAFPRNQREFVRGLAAAGARITAIGEASPEMLDAELRGWLHGYEQVSSVVNEPELLDTVKRIQAREWADRLEATVEAHVMAAAHVREACGIPGVSTKTTFLCRDKPAMKEVLREGGIATAQSTGAASRDEVVAFAKRVGYPVILKPRAAAGASGTYKASNAEELEQVIRETHVDKGAAVACEEYIEGHEGFYDTLAIDGKPAYEFISHYYPNVLEAMRERWISPQIITTNRLDAPHYAEIRTMAKKVIDLLEITTSATHMEWFYGPNGLKFSEIGCRPPGVSAWDLYGAAHEIDLYKEWANAIVHGKVMAPQTHRFSAGMINLRPERDGHITAYEGLAEIKNEFAPWIIDSHFPPPGSTTQGVEAGYMANAWMRLRHPDYDELHKMMNHIGETVKIRAA